MKSKTKKLLAIGLSLALAAGCTMVLSACDPEEEPPVLTDEPLAGETVADFTQGASERFFSSDGWTNGSVFNTWWSGSNVLYEDGVMQLTIDENPDGSEENNNEYFGGEARSHEWYGYGDFEVRMKPAKKAGTASTFFTCTGDYDTNLEGERFETERLYWDQKKELIYSDTIVKITDATGTVIYGDDFRSNQSLSNYTIQNGRANIILKDEE